MFSKAGRKEMFYLTTHSTHLNGVKHMVKGQSDSEKGNLLSPHGLIIPISSNGYFIYDIPQTGLHIPQALLHQYRGALAGTRNSSMGPLSHHDRTLLPRTYISPPPSPLPPPPNVFEDIILYVLNETIVTCHRCY